MSTTTALQDAVAALTRLGCKPAKSGNGYKALCPVHEADGGSHTPSLTVAAGDTQPIVVCCQAGCDGRQILKVLGINGTAHKSATIAATYRYQTAEGIDVREKLRYEPKDFRIRHKDAAGNWIYKAGDGPAVLYRLPELRAAIAEGRTVFMVEGEKDADRLARLGLVATTNIEGAAKPEQRAKWRSEYTEQLSGAARVVLLPDADEPGRAHMRHVAEQLRGKVGEVRWLELSGLPEKGDASDWLNAGHTADELKALAQSAEHLPEHSPEHSATIDDEFIPIGDFIASPPNSSYLVKGVLPASGLGQFFGPSHVGKSFVMIDLACHVALGRDWHGHKTKKTSVLYIAAEGIAGLKLRFRAWFQAHNVAPPPNLRIRTIPTNLTEAEATAAIAERMERLPERPELVLIDTFATNYGPGSENDDEDMKAAIAGLRRIQGDGLVLSAHHTGHADKTRSRGHSSLFAALDVEIHVTQEAKRVRIGHTKLRDGGSKIENIAEFEFKAVPLPWADEDGDPLNSAVLVKTEQSGTCSATAERLPASQRIALDALRAALVAHGTEGRGVVSVAEDEWRQAAYDAGISSGDARAKRQAFQRARIDLIAKKRVSVSQDRFWIPDPRGTKRNKAEHVPQCSAGENMGEAERNGTSSFKGCSDVPPPCSPNEELPALDSKPQQQEPTPATALDTINYHCAAPASGTAPDLETLLAAEAGIDLARMRADRLSDSEWSTLLAANARLAERLPADAQAGLRALLDQIDAAQVVALQ